MDTTQVRPSFKILFVAGAAFMATLLCFYLMFFLIARELAAPVTVEMTTDITPTFERDQPKEKPLAMRARPEKMIPVDPPPDPEAVPVNRASWVELRAEKPTFGSMADLMGPMDIQLELEAPHSELSPLLVVQPIYPLRAAMKEIEGFVIVEFTVKENGDVLNPVVITSEPEVLFDEAALNAVSRFRFKPREVGGDTVRVDNVQLKFSFNLDTLYDIPPQT